MPVAPLGLLAAVLGLLASVTVLLLAVASHAGHRFLNPVGDTALVVMAGLLALTLLALAVLIVLLMPPSLVALLASLPVLTLAAGGMAALRLGAPVSALLAVLLSPLRAAVSLLSPVLVLMRLGAAVLALLAGGTASLLRRLLAELGASLAALLTELAATPLAVGALLAPAPVLTLLAVVLRLPAALVLLTAVAPHAGHRLLDPVRDAALVALAVLLTLTVPALPTMLLLPSISGGSLAAQVPFRPALLPTTCAATALPTALLELVERAALLARGLVAELLAVLPLLLLPFEPVAAVLFVSTLVAAIFRVHWYVVKPGCRPTSAPDLPTPYAAKEGGYRSTR